MAKGMLDPHAERTEAGGKWMCKDEMSTPGGGYGYAWGVTDPPCLDTCANPILPNAAPVEMDESGRGPIKSMGED
jgi:hypothetical protein